MGWMRIECHRSSQWSSLCTCSGNASSWSPVGRGEAAPLNSWTGLGDMFLRWMSQVLRRFYIPILLNRENHQFCILEFLQQIIFYSFSVILFFKCLFTGKALCVSIVAQFLLYGMKQLTQPLASAISLSFFFVWRIVIFLYDYYNNNYNS